MTNIRRSGVLAVTIMLSSGAFAAGQVEINQARALAGGISAGDTAGYPVTISEPGSYVLTGNLTLVGNGFTDGIIIDANNVTLDMGGFTLAGTDAVFVHPGGSVDPSAVAAGRNGDDGIVVLGSQSGIQIRNGAVVSWGSDGINALSADSSLFENLHVGNNGGDGLVCDFDCVISRVTAYFNGLDGIEGDDGTVIVHSSAHQNGDNGIQTSEGCVVAQSAAFNNFSDGVDVGAGSVVINVTASDNRVFGIDLALGGTVQGSVAYDNIRTGIDVASASIVRDNVSTLNGSCAGANCPAGPEHGIRTFANAWVVGNKSHENDGDGIRISSTDVLVEDNSVTDNDVTGIQVTSSGGLIVRNKAAGNITDYVINVGNAFGPIVNVTGVGNIAGIPNSGHPQANFIY